MRWSAEKFYRFSGSHSLLIGLLPFFIPVLLWKQGVTLSGIAAFISVSAIGFILALTYWDRLRFRQQWRRIVLGSFVAEIALVALLALDVSGLYLVGLALVNGIYNGFYWSTQRVMFSAVTSQQNSGKTFGNFQILVVILLKLGILLGGYLIEYQGMLSVLLLSVMISGVAVWMLHNTPSALSHTLPEHELNASPVSAREVWRFRDAHRSKWIFLLDGPFLYLESYFWVLSLYWLMQQSVVALSLVVVVLTLMLSVVFVGLKNRIDHMNQARLYLFAVILYAVSWGLRAQLNTEHSPWIIYTGILLIAFLTTFFRLAFNKRFFDIAKDTTTHRYLVCKSYYSQASIAGIFLMIAWGLRSHDPLDAQLTSVYALATPLALLFAGYGWQYLTQRKRAEGIAPEPVSIK
ncbi:MAG: hypothetical protein H7A00_08585 [Hahellaceae bacterium]|nr:hypothetical protein [Hahellaceae bacterium]